VKAVISRLVAFGVLVELHAVALDGDARNRVCEIRKESIYGILGIENRTEFADLLILRFR
jgi:hypothetical protein